ncbi:OmpH family outer membrane protein [Candidatus Magnetaquicoccus inordinatus]|uniref:OmpH family outer membrane protein n=1 Tax=Candidatus Magnetaquicoccus inordinatus TaxID=2496818 RepID=UPI00102B4993|nr:OmpH family outer membrane protein [Candidatus Magnetaquicoccus inordinatus]
MKALRQIMQRRGFTLCCGLFLALLLSTTVASADSYKLAFVDVPRAMAASDAAKQARDILQKKLAAKQQEVSAMEDEIKAMKAEIEKRKGGSRPDSAPDPENELRSKLRDYQRLVEDNQAAIDRENGRWTKKITEALLKVIEEIGREDGYTVVFGKGQVLFAAGSIDITDRVLVRLNERTKKWF